MTGGDTLPRPDADAADPWEGFTWDLEESYNIASVALATAEDHPKHVALAHTPLDGERATVTYAALAEATDAFAARLARAGVGDGDRIGVCLPQCPELVVAHLAAFRLGAVVVPLSMLLGADSFTHSLAHSGATLLVADEVRADELGDTIDASGVRTLRVAPGGYDDAPAGGLAAHLDIDGFDDVEPARTAPGDPALLLYTSGTTGKPKGVVQGHQYLAGSLPGYRAWFHLFDDEVAAAARVWTPAEWAWAGALFDVVFPTLAVGGTVVSRERRSGFDAERALSFVEAERVTHAFLPATAIRRIRSAASPADHDLDSLRVVMSGGEKLPESLFAWAEGHLTPAVNEAYGQTEANALVGNCRPAYPVEPGSMGRAYPGHDVVVVDDGGEEVPAGTVGEIAVRLPDPVVFRGYWRDEDATAAKLDDGLFRTGDLALCDEDGYFWHHGRRDDLVLSAGYRVSPFEVEASLEAHPDVADALVGGVPDPERGERVKAFVVLCEGVETSDDLEGRLRAAVRGDVGAHKVPREIEIIDAIPETNSGKADRSALFE